MKVKVKRYKGERALARGLRKMQSSGWQVQTQQSRKAAWSWLGGIFTRKQIHTVTYVKTPDLQSVLVEQNEGVNANG